MRKICGEIFACVCSAIVLCGALLWAAPGVAAIPSGGVSSMTVGAAKAGPAAPDSGFRVVRTALNVEADKAEICLTFNNPLGPLGHRARFANLIALSEDGAQRDVAPEDLSLTPLDLCVEGLLHRHAYRLAIKGLEDEAGNALKKNVNLTFRVPDRKAALTFVPPARLGDFERLPALENDDAFSLRSVNVTQTRLTLYRIKDPKKWALAFQQIVQNNLAPSESRTFAAQNGDAVWNGTLVFGDKPNMPQTLAVPRPEGALPPGLYFLAAAPAEAGETSALFAGRWFRIGNVRLEAVRRGERLAVFATKPGKNGAVAGASVRLLSRDGSVWAEAKTDAAGTAFFTIDREKKNDSFLIALDTAAGEMDLMDGARLVSLDAETQAMAGRIVADRNLYAPGVRGNAALWFADAKGAPVRIDGSALKLLRPNGDFYSETRVSNDTLVSLVPFDVPPGATPGDWTLLWQKDDGQVLARQLLPVGGLALDGTLDVHADRAMLEKDGTVVVSLKARDAKGAALPWRRGRILVRQSALTLPAWKNFLFGNDGAHPESLASESFVTDGDGNARVKLALTLGDAQAARCLVFESSLEGMRVPALLSLPVRSEGVWIGIKPLATDAFFPENGEARFSLVAVDANGKRKASGNLYYQIYEEGRSFKWYQAEGHWDYQPLPNHRRVGGGRLTLGASGEAFVRWPVTAGQYVLEIADDEGHILARRAFEAGGLRAASLANAAQFNVAPESGRAGAPLKISLAEASFVSYAAWTSDGLVAGQQALPAGQSVLDWSAGHGKKDKKALTRFWARACPKNGPCATVDLRLPPPDAPMDMTASLNAAGTALGVQIGHGTPRLPTNVALFATPLDARGDAAPTLEPAVQKLAKDSRTVFHLPPPAFQGTLSYRVVAWNAQEVGTLSAHASLHPALEVQGDMPAALEEGDKTVLSVRLSNGAGAEGNYRYAWILPEALRTAQEIKGAVSLKRGQGKNLSLTLQAAKSGAGTVHLELTGPGGFHAARLWSVVVGAPLEDNPLVATTARLAKDAYVSLPLKTAQKGTRRGFLIAPFPVPAFLPEALASFVAQTPGSTAELARWVALAPQWKDQIAALGLMSAGQLDYLRKERLEALLRRQRDDGGFVAWPYDTEEDMVSTAIALPVVQEVREESAVVGARWLRHRLENVWFDDSERPARAEAVLALALLRPDLRNRAQAGDPAPLRYLADTSGDKPRGPVFAANLALGLQSVGDADRARSWLARAQAGLAVPTEAPDGRVLWAAFARLAMNPLLEIGDLTPAMTKAAQPAAADTPDEVLALLSAYGAAAARFGTWHVQAAGKDEKIYGMGALPPLEKNAVLSLRNASANDLQVLDVSLSSTPLADKTGRAAFSLQRLVFARDGKRLAAEAPLKAGETYLIVLRVVPRGDKGDDMPLRLDVPGSAALQPLLQANAPVPFGTGSVTHAAFDGTSAVFAFDTAKDGAQAAWLCRATAPGTYHMPPALLSNADGHVLSVQQAVVQAVVVP